jgi:hypothetical protein
MKLSYCIDETTSQAHSRANVQNHTHTVVVRALSHWPGVEQVDPPLLYQPINAHGRLQARAHICEPALRLGWSPVTVVSEGKGPPAQCLGGVC